MAGKQSGGYEAELNRIRALSDSIIPKTSALIHALESLDGALAKARKSEFWTGSSAEAATAAVDEIREKFTRIRNIVTVIDSAVGEGNEARRTAASAELPSAAVDPFWANAAKGASFVVHPVLGPLAADKALDVIGDFLGNQREEAARKIVEAVERSLVRPTRDLSAASKELSGVGFVESSDERIDDGPTGGPEIDAPRIGSPGIGGVPSGSAPGVGGTPPPSGGIGTYQPPVPTPPVHPTFPTPPTNPSGPGIGWDPVVPGGEGPGLPGGKDPSIDSPGGGLLPGGPGGTGGGGGYPTSPGGYVPGGAGGGGLGGIVGGGAGAAAIAASSKIAGFGSMGGLGGAGLGPGAGAGLKAGGGLLGNSAVGGVGGVGGAGGPGGMAGAGGVGGAGASGTGSSGAAGAGGRPGMGMMGGAGGADEEEKAKRSGLGGPIAPKLEDDEEAGPRAKGARAGSRDEPTD
ncbi:MULTISPECIES: hypothetical protein [unclassified Microbacterium]|uniref:hypothetical protein n=1 Tax=unclassified Microbacterium TaxID=2609290 RepID=UPI0008F498AD|nr:hypothetical protein [Microbacterium sp. LCT-H2]OIJ34395.1 hypothetical protein BK819_02605 [Microbacterium sp. LCT-H2]